MTALHFEIISYVLWIVTIVLLMTVWRGNRDHWWLFWAFTLCFPFEWIADNFWMFLQYDRRFTMLFGRFPLMMPFAWAWFFAIPLILMFRNKEKIDRLPPVDAIDARDKEKALAVTREWAAVFKKIMHEAIGP